MMVFILLRIMTRIHLLPSEKQLQLKANSDAAQSFKQVSCWWLKGTVCWLYRAGVPLSESPTHNTTESYNS